MQANQSQPVNMVTQVMSNPNILQGVHLVNMNAVRQQTAGNPNQKTLAPRMVLSNQLRIATPQILGARQGTSGNPGSMPGTITLPHGNLVRGTLLLKTDNGQFQLVNVNQTITPTSNPSTGTFRFQTVPQGTPQSIRSIAPQQVTVSLPLSQAGQQVKLHQAQAGTPAHTVVQTILHGSQPTVSMVTTTPGSHSQSIVTVPSLVHHMTSSASGTIAATSMNVHSPMQQQTLSSSTTTQNAAASQMSPDTAKKKCKNFLSTLLRLASDQAENVATNVKNLIQGLIDGNVQPENFTNQLQRELNSSPQPCLVPFLKKSLPYLRLSLAKGELVIDGVRPPPANVIITQAHHGIQAQQPQLRLMTPGAVAAHIAQPGFQGILPQQRVLTPGQRITAVHGKSLLAGATMRPIGAAGAAITSPATVGALQRIQMIRGTTTVASAANKEKEKRSYSSMLRDDDDINDVAAMGGVNLVEESARILATNADFVGTQIRSCKDENFLYTGPLQRRIKAMAAKYNLEEPPPEVAALLSHATQERLKNLVEKLNVIAEHRLDIIKTDPRYEVTQDVKGQLKFLEELDRLEMKRHEEQEREMLMRAAKSRSKVEDPEQMKLKLKAKEMQRAEMEELRQREANMTALLAIGPRKKLKTETMSSNSQIQIAPELAFYILLNGLGLVNLLLDEIVKRRSFLDQRSWVETTLSVKYQEEQEEKLMLSIIPKYIAVSLKPVIREAIENMRVATPIKETETYVAFHDLFVQRQNNVSILFADIVNFTPLTETMDVAKLVEMLNELFGRFDDVAEKHSCLRIKIIGDCYYCVCGIPEPLPNHAYNCVSLGFEMIDIICDIRQVRGLNIDMRIGINSGDILCGVIGMKKWQYDVWSRDVTIANLMEQSGKSGKVHITKATRELLADQFRFEKGNGALRNSTVKDWQIETFFVVPPNKTEENDITDGTCRRVSIKPQRQRRVSFAPTVQKLITENRNRSNEMPLNTRRKTMLDQSLMNYRRIITRVNSHMEETINKMALSKKEKSNILIISGCAISIFYFCVAYVAWHNFIIRECFTDDLLDSVQHYELKGLKKLLNVLCKYIHKKVWVRLFIWLTFVACTLTWTFIAGWYATTGLKNISPPHNVSNMTAGTNGSHSHAFLDNEARIQPRVEYLSRLSFLWKENLIAEQEETAVIDLVNKTLLLNILPFHVAQRYFSNSMPRDELFNEEYEEVAVMFASISNFMDFYTENELNLNGKSCLKILNEIILDFDQLLAETQFLHIEKMKVVGSTYMAAAGLRPGIRGTQWKKKRNLLMHILILETLTNFAISMMKKLSILNQDALQEFQLRIGIDCGRVIAGVVGASKPLYDIWGNTVNVASRMDSTGKMGRIQVTEKSALILMQRGFECQSRGLIHVKGKAAPMKTYFVKTPYDSEEMTRF
uniref:adenylate cyclase n=1 Tax=Strigamia maritima TaxID=126957 RepID=T1IJ33_STRMM